MTDTRNHYTNLANLVNVNADDNYPKANANVTENYQRRTEGEPSKP